MLPESIFSRRLPCDLTPSDLDRLWRTRPDLTPLMQSNPTQCGFIYPDLRVPLVGPDALGYVPEPFGAPAAREHLAAFLAESGQPIRVEHLALTASTSEAYGMLFKLLCNPGDAVAVGTPAYPLVSHLAELEGVQVRFYSYDYAGRWRLNLDSVRAVIDAGVKALVLIAPNNPTGATLGHEDGAALAGMCAAAGVPIILDEVFAPYRLQRDVAAVHWLGDAPLVCVLNGLSKAAALPQLKLGWVALHGDPAWVREAVVRLEWIADAYLSVSTVVQQALPDLLKLAPALQAQIRARVAINQATLRNALTAVPAVSLLHWEGGWYAVLQVPQVRSEAAWVRLLAEQGRVVVHPGFFYDFSRRGFLVVGLLLPPEQFDPACSRLTAVLHAGVG